MKLSIKNLIFAILIVLISNGIVYSQGVYWEPVASVSGNSVYRLSVADNGNIYTITSYSSKIFYSTNNGDTWIQIANNDLGGYMMFAIEHPISGSVFIGGHDLSTWVNGVLFRLNKDGEFWEKVLELSNSSHFMFMDMVVKASGDIYAVGIGTNGGCNIYYSSDNGDTWIEKSEGVTTIGFDDHRSFWSLALAIDGTLYAAGRSGVYRLDDGVDTWVKISGLEVYQITVSADGSIFLATYSGVFKSTDKGATWKESLGLSVDRIVYNPVTNHLFTNANNLVYISTDLGESWNSNITSNLPVGANNYISSFAVNPKTGMVFVSCEGPSINRPVYRLKVTSKEDIESFLSDKSPTLVIENYPNPFNLTTSIQYHLSESTLVTLKVYDVMGREIATLINNKMQLKGSYSSTFSGSGLPSGVYFYTLFANGKPYTQKMLLMK